MNNELTKRDVSIALNFLYGAREYIFPKLRLASMTWDNHSAEMYFYIDGQISDDDDESLSLIETYFSTDFSRGEMDSCYQHLIRVDAPAPIPFFEGECLYARKENPPVGRVKRGVLTEKWLERREKVLLALQRAMIGHIFPQIRNIIADWDELSASIYFRIDGAISDNDLFSVEQIRQYFLMQFPREEMTHCDAQVIRIDFPTIPIVKLGTTVYSRKEYPSL